MRRVFPKTPEVVSLEEIQDEAMQFDSAAFKKRRQELLLTQHDLVAKTGLSARTVARAENGEEVSLGSAARLVEVLGRDVLAESRQTRFEQPRPNSPQEPGSATSKPAASDEDSSKQSAPRNDSQGWPIAGLTKELSKRDFIMGSFSFAGALFGGLNFFSTRADRWGEEEKRSAEQREMAFRLLFGDSEAQYYVPSVNNPYSTITGITAPTSDALAFLFRHFGFQRDKFVKLNDPRTSDFDGSVLLLGGPVANVFSRQLMGVGKGSPLLSHVYGKPVSLPISFDNIVSSEAGVGKRPRYAIRVEGRTLQGLENGDRDFLVLTSMPNIFSPGFGVFGHRITVAAGWHGAGTRAIELVLSQPRLLDQLYKRVSGCDAWQALIRVGDINKQAGVPRRICEWRVFEIEQVDFNKVHEAVLGQSFWIHPRDRIVRA